MMYRIWRRLLLSTCLAISGLAPAWSQGSDAPPAAAKANATAANPQDPWESFNRQIFGFNEVVDGAVLRPVARAYRDNTPQLVQTGVSNFFGNLRDLWSGVNSALQAKPVAALENVGRFVVNTTVGIYGLFDVATHLGLERHTEDFGQTLGRWGVPSGPYVVMPLFGSSTVRDAIGFVPDRRSSLINQVDDGTERNLLLFSSLVSLRAQLLPLTDQIERVALDKYSFTRDAFLQKRLNDVYDGDPPQEKELPETPDAGPSADTSSAKP
ncbi:MAG: VacJ family lipoprotein [Alphaproteobacteria bacterium]|nr:VacJ family lipoprotein [Alphaproteobacteria bacterium]MDI9329839.1 VacJ family lipoprotein [Alphaproteobacteria bacterium]